MLNNLVKVSSFAVLAFFAGAVLDAQTVQYVVPLKDVPSGIAVDYLTNKIWVAIPSDSGPKDSVTAINGKPGTIDTTIKIPPIGQQIAIDVVRDLVYVAGSYYDNNGTLQSKLAVIDGKAKKLLSLIPISTTDGLGIEGVAVDSITGTIYVSDGSDDVIDVIKKGKHQIAVQIPVGQDPYGVAVNPYTNQIYVALSNGTVSVIDGTTDSVTTTTTVGGTNAEVAVNIATGNVFVTDNEYGISTVAVLDRNGNVLADPTVGNTPYGVDVDLVSNLAFVTNTQDDTISVIDGSTNTVTATVPVTGYSIAVNPITSLVYVAGQDNSIAVMSEN